MSDIPISKELFEALKRRGYGDPKGPVPDKGLQDPRFAQFEALRLASQQVGEIFQPQLDTLKRSAMLIMGGHVTITIDRDNLRVDFKGPLPTANAEHADRQALISRQYTLLETLTHRVLGVGWKVTQSHEPSTPTKSRSTSKPKRTRSPKKGKRKSK